MSNQMLSRISLNLIPIGFETRILEQRVGGFGFQTNARLIEKNLQSAANAFCNVIRRLEATAMFDRQLS